MRYQRSGDNGRQRRCVDNVGSVKGRSPSTDRVAVNIRYDDTYTHARQQVSKSEYLRCQNLNGSKDKLENIDKYLK